MDDDGILSPEDIFADFNARRSGLIKALTTDAEEFYHQCDRRRGNLCLYGLPTGGWEVTFPPEQVPTDIPEPPLGINFSRDGMLKQDWLYLVAVHSDSWLLAVAFYLGAKFRLNRCGRLYLFNMINDLPTVAEVVAEVVVGAERERSTVTDEENIVKMEPKGEEDVDEHDDSMCGACGNNYNAGQFWIYCDVCERWYHGKCVKITPTKAKGINKYKCPFCVVNKRVRP